MNKQLISNLEKNNVTKNFDTKQKNDVLFFNDKKISCNFKKGFLITRFLCIKLMIHLTTLHIAQDLGRKIIENWDDI